MKRDELEHVILAAANIVDDEIIVVGSQAILGQIPEAPAALLRSQEVDVYPRNRPERSDEIDGAIGDGSQFHATNGYYAHGVSPETTVAPAGWEERLVRVDVPAPISQMRDGTGWCLEVHDLVLAKLAAGRERDWEFAQEALRAGVVIVAELERRVTLMPEAYREATGRALRGVIARSGR